MTAQSKMEYGVCAWRGYLLESQGGGSEPHVVVIVTGVGTVIVAIVKIGSIYGSLQRSGLSRQ